MKKYIENLTIQIIWDYIAECKTFQNISKYLTTQYLCLVPELSSGKQSSTSSATRLTLDHEHVPQPPWTSFS